MRGFRLFRSEIPRPAGRSETNQKAAIGFRDETPLVFLPIETKVREFEPKVLCAMFAALNGYEAIVGSQDSLVRHLLLFDRGLYIDKSFTISKAKWFDELERLGHRISAWDEEGLVYYDARTYWQMRVEPSVLDRLCTVFAWGKEQGNALCQFAKENESRIRITGNPRFDLLRPEFRALYQERKEAIRKRYGRILLMNTNFSFANHFNTSADVSEMLSRYRIAKERPGFFDGLIQRHCEQFKAFQEAVPHLSRAFPEHTLIVRPHPSESHRTWLESTRNLRNVRVTAEGSVDAWIMAADCVIHSDCTTAVEAFLLDVPAIAYTASERDDYRQPLPYKLSFSVTSVDQLIHRIRELTSHPLSVRPLRQDPERLRLARQHIQGIDGDFACQRIVDGLNGIEFPHRHRSVADRVHQKLRFTWRKVLELWRKRKREGGPSYQKHKFPGLELSEVHALIHQIVQLDHRFEGINARQIAPECFILWNAWKSRTL